MPRVGPTTTTPPVKKGSSAPRMTCARTASAVAPLAPVTMVSHATERRSATKDLRRSARRLHGARDPVPAGNLCDVVRHLRQHVYGMLDRWRVPACWRGAPGQPVLRLRARTINPLVLCFRREGVRRGADRCGGAILSEGVSLDSGRIVARADFNRDGKQDIVLGARNYSGRWSCLASDAATRSPCSSRATHVGHIHIRIPIAGARRQLRSRSRGSLSRR